MASEVTGSEGAETPALSIGSRDKSVPWYNPTLSTLSPDIKSLFLEYSKIPEVELLPHIHQVVCVTIPIYLYAVKLTAPVRYFSVIELGRSGRTHALDDSAFSLSRYRIEGHLVT